MEVTAKKFPAPATQSESATAIRLIKKREESRRIGSEFFPPSYSDVLDCQGEAKVKEGLRSENIRPGRIWSGVA